MAEPPPGFARRPAPTARGTQPCGLRAACRGWDGDCSGRGRRGWGGVCRRRKGAVEKGKGERFAGGGRGRQARRANRSPQENGFGGRRPPGSAKPNRPAGPSLRLAGGAPSIYLWRGEKKLAPAGGIFERNVKFAAEAKKCAKPLDFFAEMITIVYS